MHLQWLARLPKHNDTARNWFAVGQPGESDFGVISIIFGWSECR